MEGVYYSPVDEASRAKLRQMNKEGEMLADIDSTSLVIMRAIENQFTPLGRKGLMKRAQEAAQICRDIKKRVGLDPKKREEEMEDSFEDG